MFAKGILQDGGFAWHVSGPVKGYAANTVVDQHPAAGTVVLDTGAPTITLTLARNKTYAELGRPSNGAPYNGTKVLIPPDLPNPAATSVPKPAPATRLTGRPAAQSR